jgi:CspA family cold shock protein
MPGGERRFAHFRRAGRTSKDMGKKGRDRGQRRRGFDDDAFGGPDQRDEVPYQPPFRRPPRQDAAPSGPPLDATVKWFNSEKGFGFVELADGSGDAFLHIAVLQNAGHDAVAPETKLKVQVAQGQKGRQVTAVLEVDASSAAAAPAPSRRPGPKGPYDRVRPDPSTASSLEGTVKWFNPDKGFGFAVAEDGGKDVFIHISVVEKAGMRTLADGQKISMQVVKTPKGREAISLTATE